jgi:GTP cyclohydrolase II
MALDFVNENGGAVIYLQQEGRGIGLANKVAAYALQDGGMDTVDANLHLGFPEDSRQYGVIPSILRDMNIKSIQLMTNNPRKVSKLTFLGVKVEKTIPMVVPRANQHNVQYLETKQRRMNHSNFGDMLSRDLMPTQTNNGGMVPKKTTTIAETTYTSSSSLVKTRMPQNNGDTEH